MQFDTSLEFLQPYLSIKEMVIVGITVMAAVLVYLLSMKYAESAKKLVAKILPSFGFNVDETSTFSDLASGLVKLAGIATILLMAGRYLPLLDSINDVGSFIFDLIGYGISLALPIAIIYFARTWSKK